MSDTSQHDDAKQLEIGMLLYPGFTLQDLAGPQTTLGLHGWTHLFWKSLEPVMSDTGVSVNPTATFARAPAELDVLFVPGGMGTNALMEDAEVLEFLARVGPTARYVTSVCTGSLVLGMAGLLEGRRAATHWAFYETLEALGVESSPDRVVVDGNRVTGGGVTAGIDFGLTLLAELKGREAAEFTQLALEYDPQPPFGSGHPRTAAPGVVAACKAMIGDMLPQSVEIARTHKRRPQAASAGLAPA